VRIESKVKQQQIVEAAIRRFSHFGISKTSLVEVAEDLAVTKQVLSYYFPDKDSLVQAVIDTLTTDYIAEVQKAMDTAPTVEQALLQLTNVKAVFFEKYYMLASQAEHLELTREQSYHHWRALLTEKESALLKNLFQRGIASGELKHLEIQKTAELLLETLYAFSNCVKDKGALPDAAAFSEMLSKQREVIQLFYQGLKSGTWAN
jgi:TetR/AcrR family transcriptional regulator